MGIQAGVGARAGEPERVEPAVVELGETSQIPGSILIPDPPTELLHGPLELGGQPLQVGLSLEAAMLIRGTAPARTEIVASGRHLGWQRSRRRGRI